MGYNQIYVVLLVVLLIYVFQSDLQEKSFCVSIRYLRRRNVPALRNIRTSFEIPIRQQCLAGRDGYGDKRASRVSGSRDDSRHQTKEMKMMSIRTAHIYYGS